MSRRPLTLGPSSGGVRTTTEVTIRARTVTMTSSAIRIPRQLRWLGLADTSSWNKLKKKHKHLKVELEHVASQSVKFQFADSYH